MPGSEGVKKYGLNEQGISNVGKIYWNPPIAVLCEEIVRRQEGIFTQQGAVVVNTGKHTGRSPNDKFIVKELSSENRIWWGKVNRPFEEAKFESLQKRMFQYLQGKELFVQDCFAGADEQYRLPIRVITEFAWHSVFALNMFIRIQDPQLLREHIPQFTIISLPKFQSDPKVDGTNSETFIIINFDKRLVLIGGTAYAGEIKKSVFTILNYLLPLKQVLSMHCSANAGDRDDVAIFFGLSGTGKTSLSTDSRRPMIGDDEHGWSDRGVFNFEGGCYAKVIRLSPTAEPEIYACTRKFGTILENVIINETTREIDLDDATLTENTRSSYPITYLSNLVESGMGGHPKHVVMLTCDAFGVMPPIARLSQEQAMYHFLSGYTAKVAGTERGMGSEPQVTFSTCFGAPFLVHPPSVYANLLGKKIAQHRVSCWLVNTGWSGGPFGVGKRINIAYTRAMLRAALEGKLDKVPTQPDPIFGVEVPTFCEAVPAEILQPRNTWQNKEAYDAKARELAVRFEKNFQEFSGDVSEKVKNSGAKIPVS